MLSSMDDYPLHQVPDVIRHVGTSDRNFYDRYYFNLFDTRGGLMLIMGLGQYPNLGIQDAFALARRGTEHRVVRASRTLGDRMDTSVGAFRVEVLEGLRRVRFVLEPNEHGIELDLSFPEAGLALGGEVGFGLFEYGFFGPFPRYGFREFMDGAP